MKQRKIIAIDLDNTLTNGGKWWEKEPMVNEKVRDWAVKMYKEGNVIIIYTARRNKSYSMTKRWLDKNLKYYHALVMDKLAADIYLDDNNMLVSEIEK